ncbi:GLIPR1-like protein 1 isoform X1 [Hemicordylus capensis]|uniref:GLIPR1-like protein 1 isoform X1 n=1 Tax=Hemicordylus capensis TaxID=884348 RepID=UPI0023036EBE|nr:GLIPR1-like protein 1 isoform X1 [Hemicordylus capensis]
MRLWLLLWLALASLTNTRGKKPFVPLPYPKINNRTFIKECLDAHNKHRSEVNPPASDMLYMTWDLALARTARAWANKCIFEHNPYRGHPHPKLRPTGENLLAGGAIRRPYNSASAIRVFYNEVKYYNYNKHSCTHVCGHYTQVVWSTSYKLGCAIVFCPKFGHQKNIEYFVCNYAPTGNLPWRPYEAGRPCSKCQKGDTCENNLCRNPERDREIVKRYSRWYPPFEHRIICDESCIALAVLRPLLMFVAFAAVFYLQKRYPNLILQK